jgi:hypothetical protein
MHRQAGLKQPPEELCRGGHTERRNIMSETLGALLSGPVMFIVVAWSLVWKGVALWKAARRDQLAWFIVLLVVNTVGILEIIYIFAIAPRQRKLGHTW